MADGSRNSSQKLAGFLISETAMEELFKLFAGRIALAVEGAAVLLILIGAVEALYLTARRLIRGANVIHRKQIWIRFAIWLVLALEFELAADVVRSAISPTWSDIGQLGAIAAIRTFLNYFLERDIEAYGEGSNVPERETRPTASIA